MVVNLYCKSDSFRSDLGTAYTFPGVNYVTAVEEYTASEY